MANTFGTALIQVPLSDPRDPRRFRQRFFREAVPELEYANSLYVPGDDRPARGWILLTRSRYDKVRGYGNSFTLNLADVQSNTSLTFTNLAIVQARCVTRGVAADPSAVYLVELTDQRGILANQWFDFPTNVYYNVLAPAYPTLYYSQSMNGGSPWTWSGMIGDLWGQMTTFLGAFPGLPVTPSGTPTNWNLPGVSAWNAMNAMLEHVGLSVSCDLTKAMPYGIVSYGANDATFDALTLKYAGNLQDDLEWIDVGSGRVPGTVVVLFRRINQYYGTEETVRRDSLQWETSAIYPVGAAAPAFFAGAQGTHFIHDDFPVRYDIDGNPLSADVATANAVAAERVQQYFGVIYSQTAGYMDRTYAGVLPFYAGSQVDGVCWRQDYAQGRGAWRTQIMRGHLWEMLK
jgi:hypothetical protein